MRWVLTISLALALVGCDDDEGTVPGLDLGLVDARGRNAAGSIESGRLVVEVEQEGEVQEGEGEVIGGAFDVTLPFPDPRDPIAVRARLEGGTRTRFGAAPSFTLSNEDIPFVRLVMVDADRCERLELDGVLNPLRFELGEPRVSPAFVRRGTFALTAGGVFDGAPSSRAELFDLLTFSVKRLPEALRSPLGAASGVALTPDASLVVGDARATLFTPRPSDRDPTEAPIELYPGVGARSSALGLGSAGAVVLGGDDTNAIAWLSTAGDLRGTGGRLAHPRREAAVAGLSGGVLLVGGGGEDAPPGEWIPTLADGRALELDLPPGRGGALIASPAGDAALWIGGRDLEGEPFSDTFLVTGCPADCRARPGPSWERPRANPAHTPSAAGHWLLGGESEGAPSAAVDRVVWEGNTPRIESAGDLVVPRSGARAVELAAGIVLIAGGRSPEGVRNDLELCAPPDWPSR